MRAHYLRDTGKWIAERVPGSQAVLKRIYAILPTTVHDHPADFLKRYFDKSPQVRFIQIGAHDGIAGDPIRPNVLRNTAWSGILIEPNPWLFEQLKVNYQGREGLEFKRAAVSDSSGVLPLYIVDGRGKETTFPSWWSEISSLDKNHLMRELPAECHAYIDEIEVPVVTVLEIMSETAARDIDLIAMDVEGHEPAILRHILQSGIRPDVLVFEHKHMAESALREVMTQFGRCGYRAKTYGRDTVFYRQRGEARAAN